VGHRVALGGDVVGGAWRYGDQVTGFVPPWREDVPDDAIVADLAAAFRVPPGVLTDPVTLRWSDQPHIAGCDVGFRPGQLTRLGPFLRTGHGPVHFSGAERSSWPNNMEGAIESGERAASEAIRRLRTE
jgi:monoamine oxidase